MLTYLLAENAEGGGWTSYIWIIVLLVLLVVCPLIFNNGIISALVAYADKNGSLTKNQKIFYLVAFFLFPVGTLVFAALLAFTAARELFGF